MRRFAAVVVGTAVVAGSGGACMVFLPLDDHGGGGSSDGAVSDGFAGDAAGDATSPTDAAGGSGDGSVAPLACDGAILCEDFDHDGGFTFNGWVPMVYPPEAIITLTDAAAYSPPFALYARAALDGGTGQQAAMSLAFAPATWTQIDVHFEMRLDTPPVGSVSALRLITPSDSNHNVAIIIVETAGTATATLSSTAVSENQQVRSIQVGQWYAISMTVTPTIATAIVQDAQVSMASNMVGTDLAVRAGADVIDPPGAVSVDDVVVYRH